ncbi:MAG: pyridoxal phosphate-dependent aminotransferase [Acetobacterales bacterium]
MVELADRLNRLSLSASAAISALARELREQGKDVISLSSGEPDFDTPDHIKQAAWEAIQRGETKYTNTDGTRALKEAVRDKFRRENGLDFQLNEITVGNGAKQVLYNAMMATLNDGDEVVVAAPHWISYTDMVVGAGGRPVIVPCSQNAGFKLRAEDLEAALTPRTRWVMLNSPSNPSGAAYTRDELKELCEVLRQHPKVLLASDDIYEHILYDGLEFATPAQFDDEIKARTLTVNGVSKAYAMTGWRIGYAAGPRDLIKGMLVMQGQVTAGASSVGQAAATAALNGPQEIVRERRDAFQERRDTVVKMLNECPGVICHKPQGAFYVYPNIAGTLGKKAPSGKTIETDEDFVAELLRAESVAAVHGAAYNLSPYFRISYAASMDELVEACGRIRRFCESLN